MADYPGSTNDGYVQGTDASTYSAARTTSDSFNADQAALSVGQTSGGGYWINRGFLEFDTSAIPDNANILQANLTLTVQDKYTSGAEFDLRIHKFDWSSPLSAGNQEANYDGALAAALDQVWKNTAAVSVNTPYASPNLDTAWIAKTGYTRYALVSSRDAAGTTAVPYEYVNVCSASHMTAGYRPVLSVTYALPQTYNDTLTVEGIGEVSLIEEFIADPGAFVGRCATVKVYPRKPEVEVLTIHLSQVTETANHLSECEEVSVHMSEVTETPINLSEAEEEV